MKTKEEIDALFERWSQNALKEFDERTDSLNQTRKEYNDKQKQLGYKKKSNTIKAPFYRQGVFEKAHETQSSGD